jgi:hypothetical protein
MSTYQFAHKRDHAVQACPENHTRVVCKQSTTVAYQDLSKTPLDARPSMESGTAQSEASLSAQPPSSTVLTHSSDHAPMSPPNPKTLDKGLYPPPPPRLPTINPSSLSPPENSYVRGRCLKLSPPKDLHDWQRWSDSDIWPNGKASGADLDIVIPCAHTQDSCCLPATNKRLLSEGWRNQAAPKI